MLFNSIQFVIFFPCVVALFFLAPQRTRWMILLAASYYFYACWKVEYLALIVVSTLVDYLAALGMGRTASGRWRRALLAFSLLTNLGLLFAFKYFNFVSESVRAAFQSVNLFYDAPLFDVLLPVGISFYTFQSLSYTIDVYRGQRNPERHLGIFALYVAFFPQLVAGPIERSTHLLPQFRERQRLNMSRVADGMQLVLWGFFKKLVIADRLALFVNEVFSAPGAYQGAVVIVAVYFFAFQIYCDFSGYSDIAVGTARILGYDLMENFRRPYFARSIAEFWRRWHVSLSSWFRDYLYVPLGGNRVSPLRRQVNIAIVFLVSGLWHGANWTFVVWGGLHGLYYLVGEWTRPWREHVAHVAGLDRTPVVRRTIQIIITFHLASFAWFFFRAASIGDALTMIRATVHGPFFPASIGLGLPPEDVLVGAGAVLGLLWVEGVNRAQLPAAGPPLRNAPFRSPFGGSSAPVRFIFCYGALLAILVFGKFTQSPFIYFQF